MSQRTEKDILGAIEDYSRATMISAKRTARNTAFIKWFVVISFVFGLIFYRYNS